MNDLCDIEIKDRELAQLYCKVLSLARVNKMTEINQMIVEVTASDFFISIGMLRGTFVMRYELPAWGDLVERTRVALMAAGKDPNRPLRGLKL